ncbi:hypothetical protein SEUCBS140593_006036 [Sporothrix eucalyptigena]|uniref:Uncharacterized protein n=1 Tax=Sporothrix eucalyptigena TaxID=1812306 RepID=A0ABP0C3R8_9PEZI
MYKDISKIKVPPEGMVTPRVPHLVFTIILHIPVLVMAAMGTRDLIRKKSPTMLCFLAGGYVSSLLEAVVDINGMCYFPIEGQIVGIYDYERAIPLFVVATYSWFMGGQGYFFKKSLDAQLLTKRMLWVRWIATMGVNLLLEIPMLLLGMYCYYGPQPFKIAGFPIWWLIVNTVIPVSSGFAAHVLAPHLQGWKELFIILIVPMADGFSNAALGFPMWCALNSEWDFSATYPAFFLTVGLGSFFIWMVSLYLPTEAPIKFGSEREPLLT